MMCGGRFLSRYFVRVQICFKMIDTHNALQITLMQSIMSARYRFHDMWSIIRLGCDYSWVDLIYIVF